MLEFHTVRPRSTPSIRVESCRVNVSPSSILPATYTSRQRDLVRHDDPELGLRPGSTCRHEVFLPSPYRDGGRLGRHPLPSLNAEQSRNDVSGCPRRGWTSLRRQGVGPSLTCYLRRSGRHWRRGLPHHPDRGPGVPLIVGGVADRIVLAPAAAVVVGVMVGRVILALAAPRAAAVIIRVVAGRVVLALAVVLRTAAVVAGVMSDGVVLALAAAVVAGVVAGGVVLALATILRRRGRRWSRGRPGRPRRGRGAPSAPRGRH